MYKRREVEVAKEPTDDFSFYPPLMLNETDMTTVKLIGISEEPVELHKILKFEGMVSSGGQAKSVIAEGRVKVNGTVETRKRRKIVSGDIVEFGNEQFRIQRSHGSMGEME